MHPSHYPSSPQSASGATATSDPAFVETLEYLRFVEFCDACREFRYIGLCYGAPGIGKTLSALKYSRAEMILKVHREPAESRDQLPIDTVLYTTEVVNTPARVQFDIRSTRERLQEVALRPIRKAATDTLDAIRLKDQARRTEIMNKPGCSPCDCPAVDRSYFETFEHFQALKAAVPDPTTLILVDEADRLHMNSLEVIRSIFDNGGIGIVLIGMPGIEKRVARFPQFYSRIGFVHEFRPLDETQMTTLLNEGWLPAGVKLPVAVLSPDVIATLIRMSGGNFRLLTRLLAQVERVLKVNQADVVTKEIVTAARDSLVIGQG
jgi:DNA transposition AAA+ family ATPase